MADRTLYTLYMCVWKNIHLLDLYQSGPFDKYYNKQMKQTLQQDIITHFSARVPLYASYPPVNYFHDNIDKFIQGRWLRQVASDEPISLYVHIPFCKQICWFCACRTQGITSLGPLHLYVQALCQELNLISESLPQYPNLIRLSLGGGTPTILPADLATKLLEKIFTVFKPSANFEFSVEIDPTDASEDVLQTFANFGMNRASIGVQDFEPTVQTAIGRKQSYGETQNVIKILRRSKVKNLNVDLIYGLPYQTKASFKRTLAKVAALDPDRIALCGFAYVPWMSKRQVMINTTLLPDNQARFELFVQGQKFFVEKGFMPIGIDHFSKPHDGLAKAAKQGRLQRDFQGYTEDTSSVLIGVGASSISKFPQGYVQNHPITSDYTQSIFQSGPIICKGYVLNDHDKLIAKLIESLMCYFAVSSSQLISEFPQQKTEIQIALCKLKERFSEVCSYESGQLIIYPEARGMIRVIANYLDKFSTKINPTQS